MRTLFDKLVLLTMLVAGVLALGACENTIRGIGADLEESGDAVSDAVN
ncbi:MAG TPA: EncA/B family entericidin [Alphaproteobacteria bacterium]|nr:EncA/B family entericidin [Alphaproteobacteria bacterium]